MNISIYIHKPSNQYERDFFTTNENEQDESEAVTNRREFIIGFRHIFRSKISDMFQLVSSSHLLRSKRQNEF